MIQPIMMQYHPVNYSHPNLYQNTTVQDMNKLMQCRLEDVRLKHYSDLSSDEFYASPKRKNELLFSRKKFLQLAKYGTLTNCEYTYNKIRDNPDFKELANSKYFNSANGFVKLVSSMSSLERQRVERLTVPSIPNANIIYVKPFPYEKYNINDYLRLLNEFAKNSKISEDLKQYFLMMKADKIDVYYSRLDKLSTSSNPIETLTEDIPNTNE